MGEGFPQETNPVVFFIPWSGGSMVSYFHDEGSLQYVISNLWGSKSDRDRDIVWMSYVLDLSSCVYYVSVFNFEASIF
jgi:hypothetical protein